MSKVIQSPVKRWHGTITIASPLTYPQYLAYEEALAASKGMKSPSRKYSALLPGLLACVESFNLQNFPANVTAETFPATPVIASYKLLNSIIVAVSAEATEADEAPNA
jgi:hypothetical protein